MEHKKPIFTRVVGPLRVAVWENSTDGKQPDGKRKMPWWNVSIVRRYKDAAGTWQEAPSLNGLGDLALAAEALTLAKSFITCRQDELLASE